MKAITTALSGVYVLEPTIHGDARGYFYESFNAKTFAELTGQAPLFVQDNQSQSNRGVLRGLHYQIAPKAQGKLIRVISGSVFDVVVDIRPNSPTLGQWLGFELTGQNHRQVWIPPGFAHGFVTLEDATVFQYKVTEYWSAEHERCLAWNDPTLKIDWHLDGTPLVSSKDEKGLSFKDTLHFLQNNAP